MNLFSQVTGDTKNLWQIIEKIIRQKHFKGQKSILMES